MDYLHKIHRGARKWLHRRGLAGARPPPWSSSSSAGVAAPDRFVSSVQLVRPAPRSPPTAVASAGPTSSPPITCRATGIGIESEAKRATATLRSCGGRGGRGGAGECGGGGSVGRPCRARRARRGGRRAIGCRVRAAAPAARARQSVSGSGSLQRMCAPPGAELCSQRSTRFVIEFLQRRPHADTVNMTRLPAQLRTTVTRPSLLPSPASPATAGMRHAVGVGPLLSVTSGGPLLPTASRQEM
jgi:hypothetical protein